jgi:hypothetical protein
MENVESRPVRWFYHDGTVAVGPRREVQMHSLIQEQRIRPDTLVWKDGMAQWAQADTTELSSQFPEMVAPVSPPPLPPLVVQGMSDGQLRPPSMGTHAAPAPQGMQPTAATPGSGMGALGWCILVVLCFIAFFALGAILPVWCRAILIPIMALLANKSWSAK